MLACVLFRPPSLSQKVFPLKVPIPGEAPGTSNWVCGWVLLQRFGQQISVKELRVAEMLSGWQPQKLASGRWPLLQ